MDAARQLELRTSILEAINAVVRAESGPVYVSEVRLVPGSSFFGISNGDTLLLPGGKIAVRIAVGRAPEAVVDTILHETAHVLLGPEHIDQPDHGPTFQALHERLRLKYADSVLSRVG